MLLTVRTIRQVGMRTTGIRIQTLIDDLEAIIADPTSVDIRCALKSAELRADSASRFIADLPSDVRIIRHLKIRIYRQSDPLDPVVDIELGKNGLDDRYIHSPGQGARTYIRIQDPDPALVERLAAIAKAFTVERWQISFARSFVQVIFAAFATMLFITFIQRSDSYAQEEGTTGVVGVGIFISLLATLAFGGVIDRVAIRMRPGSSPGGVIGSIMNWTPPPGVTAVSAILGVIAAFLALLK